MFLEQRLFITYTERFLVILVFITLSMYFESNEYIVISYPSFLNFQSAVEN